MLTYQRDEVDKISQGIVSDHPYIQVIIGPRQVGKSTAANQIAINSKLPYIYESADSPIPYSEDWIELQWNRASKLATDKKTILILDEIQKIKGWSEVIKRLWDSEIRKKGLVRPLILGSSALLLQKGLTESLAGRFILHRFKHWTAQECAQAFDWGLEKWFFFGGYPGAANLISDEDGWKRYITDSLIETVITKDIFQLQTVTKPALLRQLFFLAATYPSQILSYNKMLGQLTDAGNTTTLAHYLDLLESAFLISGLEQFNKGKPRKRGSSPKLILWNNALINAVSRKTFENTKSDLSWRGRIIENAVGAKLVNELQELPWSINYWRKDSLEIDFVVCHGKEIFGIEVKSGRDKKISGLELFKKEFPKAKIIILGSGGIPFEEFFYQPSVVCF